MSQKLNLVNSVYLRFEKYPVGWTLFIIICFSTVFHFWGIQKNIPYNYEIDEPGRVTTGIQMVSSGNLNPGRFRHPGSTILYPLAALFHIWDATVNDGVLFQANPNIETYFEDNPNEFYLLGRYLSVFYGILGFALTYKLGQIVFNRKVGVIAAWLVILSPIAISHVQLVRTDGASIFFSVLGLWLCFKVYDQMTLKNQTLAGVGIGLSIATKYYLGVLAFILLAIDLFVLRRQDVGQRTSRRLWLGFGIGFFSIAATFVLSSPYVILDFATAQKNLTKTMHSTHSGADGLTSFGNFVWYLRTAVPDLVFWPQTLLALTGIGLALWRRQAKPLFLLGFVTLFLIGISQHPLHWARWLFPILPPLAILASHALETLWIHFSKRLHLNPKASWGVLFAGVLLISAWPTYQVVLLGIQQANPSTRVLAREWIVENLPSGSHIVQEYYAAPLNGEDLVVLQRPSLGRALIPADKDYRDGYRYVVVSSRIYDRFLADPDRYPNEIAIYTTLFNDARLLQTFEPSRTQGGPTIRIYELRAP